MGGYGTRIKGYSFGLEEISMIDSWVLTLNDYLRYDRMVGQEWLMHDMHTRTDAAIVVASHSHLPLTFSSILIHDWMKIELGALDAASIQNNP